jgi:hydrogenase expression/formation protein HypD
MPPALRAILTLPALNVDGLILPGHVSTVTGKNYFNFVSDYGVPAVIAGFEPCDILYAILRLVEKIRLRDSAVENAYSRAVRGDGNIRAMAKMTKMFRPSDAFWRGLGSIPQSGLALDPRYSSFDARVRFGLPPAVEEPEPPGCNCAAVLSGRKTPPQCGLFGKSCTPSNPVGPCMVSSEGSCRAYYLSSQ